MSHFTVLVVGENLDEQLAPFQENNMGDCPREYMEFHDTEAEMLKEYETEGTEMIVLADGTMKFTWDDEFEVPRADFFDKREYSYPEGSVQRNVPYKERYATFEEFAQEFHGHEKRDAEKGRYGYWENPNRKWDWWSLGGRWSGFFQLRPNADGQLGKRSLLDDSPDTREGRADRAYKRDIDFDAMKHEGRYRANKTYDAFEEFKEKFPEFRGWKYFREEKFPDDIDAAREAYRAQAGHKELDEALGFKMGCWFDELSIGREKYVAQEEASALMTFAVLKDGKWYERGEMGWWGIVSDEKETDKWTEEYMKLLDELPEDAVLNVIDCHI